MESASIWMREIITPWDIYLHGAAEILAYQRTPYQELCIVRTEAFGKKLFLDGICQSSEADEFIYHETLVQPALLAIAGGGREPRRVLVLGGGEGACLREALRWRTVEQVVMVDLDVDVIEACKRHLPEYHRGSFDDLRATFVHGDAVRFLDEVVEPFDVIISDMTDPVEEGPSTFCFTEEYFARCRNALADDGVLALQAGPLSPVEISLHAKVIRSMQRAFDHVQSYPCNAPIYGRPLAFAMASSAPIAGRLAPAIADESIAAHVNGPLRYITGAVAHSLLATPPFVLEAIVSSDTTYTDAAPPQTAHAAGWESAS